MYGVWSAARIEVVMTVEYAAGVPIISVILLPEVRKLVYGD